MAVSSFLKTLGPSALDAEVRLLGVASGGGSDAEAAAAAELEIAALLQYLVAAFRTRTDFEFNQAVLNLTIRVHGEVLSKSVRLLSYLQVLRRLQKQVWSALQKQFHANLCLVSFLSKTQL